MINKKDGKRVFTRRSFIFSGIKVAIAGTIVSRLSYLQIFKSSHYKLLSDKNRLVVHQTLPSRGRILDASGRILAKNKRSYSIVLDLLDIPEPLRKETIEHITSSFDFDEKLLLELKNIPDKISRSNRYIVLQDDLQWESLAKYYIMSSTIPGILIEKNESRTYLHPHEFCHVIGYTGSPTKADIETSQNDSLMLPMAKTGKTCIEKEYDSHLFGRVGISHDEVNSRRQFIRSIDKIDSVHGGDIKLTINLDLQKEVYRILSIHKSASCVIVDVNTGAILAFVSYPGYDNNIFTGKISPKTLQKLYDDPYKPMINKALQGLYSPGSAFKMITGLAGLHHGVINEHTTFNCSGFHEIGNHKFHCWKNKYGGHGRMNLKDAISQSCDVYFYNIARLLSPEMIQGVANDFGLGEYTGIDLPNEKSGLVPNKKWKKQNRKQVWTKGDTMNMSIGQGFILATPLQLARMTAIFSNGLYRVVPFINSEKQIDTPSKLKYSKKHIDIILSGMNAAVNDTMGTAFSSSIDDDEFDMAGKTGSTQVFRITSKQRKQGITTFDDYWKKEHAIFVGYAPTDSPKFAVCVLVEHGGGGAKAAAPLARDALLAANRICMP